MPLLNIANKNLIYSDHVLKKVIERRFTPKEIGEILTTPDGIIKQSQDRVEVYFIKDRALVIKPFELSDSHDLLDRLLYKDIIDSEKVYLLITVMENFSHESLQ